MIAARLANMKKAQGLTLPKFRQDLNHSMQIGRRTESLDDCECTGLRFRPFQSSLLDQKS